jgi:hypothetical protein
MQVDSFESGSRDARTGVSCKLRKLRQVELWSELRFHYSTCMKRLRSHPRHLTRASKLAWCKRGLNKCNLWQNRRQHCYVSVLSDAQHYGRTLIQVHDKWQERPLRWLVGKKVKQSNNIFMEVWGERMYSSYSFTTSALDGAEWSVSRPGHAYPPGKGPSLPIGQVAGWAPEPVWTQRLEEKSLASAGDRTSIARSSSPYPDSPLVG